MELICICSPHWSHGTPEIASPFSERRSNLNVPLWARPRLADVRTNFAQAKQKARQEDPQASLTHALSGPSRDPGLRGTGSTAIAAVRARGKEVKAPQGSGFARTASVGHAPRGGAGALKEVDIGRAPTPVRKNPKRGQPAQV